jgi:hypothetical protein
MIFVAKVTVVPDACVSRKGSIWHEGRWRFESTRVPYVEASTSPSLVWPPISTGGMLLSSAAHVGGGWESDSKVTKMEWSCRETT